MSRVIGGSDVHPRECNIAEWNADVHDEQVAHTLKVTVSNWKHERSIAL